MLHIRAYRFAHIGVGAKDCKDASRELHRLSLLLLRSDGLVVDEIVALSPVEYVEYGPMNP